MTLKNATPLTRERHLDHMVKVVPFIVFSYGAQSFLILRLAPGAFSTISLCVLGAFLSLMIGGFVFYDLYHRVSLFSDGLKVSFLGKETFIHLNEILSVTVTDPTQSFSNLVLCTPERKFVIYFIDDADKVKQLIETNQRFVRTAA